VRSTVAESRRPRSDRGLACPGFGRLGRELDTANARPQAIRYLVILDRRKPRDRAFVRIDPELPWFALSWSVSYATAS
jgi:hypothetical protein